MTKQDQDSGDALLSLDNILHFNVSVFFYLSFSGITDILAREKIKKGLSLLLSHQ